ncbi:hypothetical protein B0H17DRAFT_1134361 [Mycena rosella]|uniref:Uncharacterized protein n=1 Tax=Mycena rosella TaxID=1033263 RepID=A0AAD7DFA4_MYCRO|nr:hypothetical protein B0H17DRAFT_1134361 [Mycena rosella]
MPRHSARPYQPQLRQLADSDLYLPYKLHCVTQLQRAYNSPSDSSAEAGPLGPAHLTELKELMHCPNLQRGDICQRNPQDLMASMPWNIMRRERARELHAAGKIVHIVVVGSALTTVLVRAIHSFARIRSSAPQATWTCTPMNYHDQSSLAAWVFKHTYQGNIYLGPMGRVAPLPAGYGISEDTFSNDFPTDDAEMMESGMLELRIGGREIPIRGIP